MQRGKAVKTTVFVLFAGLVVGCATAHAQDPPVPTMPPVTGQPPVSPPATAEQPPATAQPPVVQPPANPAPAPAAAAAPAATPAVPPKLTDAESRRRREAIFVLEGVFVRQVLLAANATQSEIEAFQPGLRISMFSAVPPQARGNYLEDYGVFFQVQIPTYIPSVVKVIEDLARVRPQSNDPARLTSLERPPSRDAVMDPDLFYVNAVRQYLVSAMLDQSRSLELRPGEWLTVSARGEDGGPSELAQPSIMVLRVRGSDLVDFLAGRLTRDEVIRRVEVKGSSGR
jgi:hypothetical protein